MHHTQRLCCMEAQLRLFLHSHWRFQKQSSYAACAEACLHQQPVGLVKAVTDNPDAVFRPQRQVHLTDAPVLTNNVQGPVLCQDHKEWHCQGTPALCLHTTRKTVDASPLCAVAVPPVTAGLGDPAEPFVCLQADLSKHQTRAGPVTASSLRINLILKQKVGEKAQVTDAQVF